MLSGEATNNKKQCYIAIVKFQLKIVSHLVITVTQSVEGGETFINLLELESNIIVLIKYGYKLI